MGGKYDVVSWEHDGKEFHSSEGFADLNHALRDAWHLWNQRQQIARVEIRCPDGSIISQDAVIEWGKKAKPLG